MHPVLAIDLLGSLPYNIFDPGCAKWPTIEKAMKGKVGSRKWVQRIGISESPVPWA